MGCCVSSHEKRKTPPKINNNNTHEFPPESKSPPIAEEEAVKEVLSETPKPKPRPDSRPESPKRRALLEQENDVQQPMKPKVMLVTTPNKATISDQKTGTKHPDPITPEEISEVSEMCSFSESGISNTTLKEDDDHLHGFHTKDTAASGEARQRVFRSQGYNGHFIHHQQHQQFLQQQQHCNKMSQGRSPARRRPEPESSPARKRYPGSVGPRREVSGENPGRRSQSPAKRANVGRSPSGRKTGPSPGRVRMVHGPESGRKVEGEEEVRRESEEWQGPKESLENPLVSLECFIFL